ncbi:MAG: hypothetical protein D6714_02870 [Bacteroidetes bacterium]|nr:MAG: hypothetical protein D6714_02870 [Bacteroidota bacterium]
MIDFDGPVSMASIFQNGNPQTVLATSVNDLCVNLEPANGYIGTSPDLIGVVLCFNGAPTQCDTTFLVVTVEKPAPCGLSANFDLTSPDCDNANGAIVAHLSGNSADLTWSWNPAVSTGDSASGLAAGTYHLTITDDSTGCQIDTALVLTAPDPVVLTPADVEILAPACPGETGAIQALAGFEMDIYHAGNLVGTTPKDNLLPGLYTLVYDNGFCADTLDVTLPSVPDWLVSPTISPATCAGNDGAISLIVTGAGGGYTFAWSPDISTSASATGLAEGTYSVTVTDVAGCTFVLDGLNVPKDCAPVVCGLSLDVALLEADLCGQNTGVIELTTAGAHGDVAFEWSPMVSLSNKAMGLAAGTYEIIAVDSAGCSDTLSVDVPATAPNWDYSVFIANETCAGNDGSIEIQVTGGNEPLTYHWTPDVSDSGQATGLSAGVNYSVEIIDSAGCSLVLENLSVPFDCQPFISTQTIKTTLVCPDSTALLCASLDELPGQFDAILIHRQPQFGSLTFENDTCLVYQTQPDFDATDTAAIVLCDDLGFCDTTWFEIQVQSCPVVVPCTDFIAENKLIAATNDCNLDAEVCFAFPLDSMLDMTIYDNGEVYFDDVAGCLHDTTLTYSYFPIPGMGNAGPYELVSWTVNGDTHSASFNSIAGLVGWMNSWDANSNWTFDTTTYNIFGGNPQNTYSSLVIEQTLSGGMAVHELSTNLTPNGAKLYLPAGTHEVVFVTPTGCADTAKVEVVCITSETLYDTVAVNESGTRCVDFSELPGNFYSSQILCNNCDNAILNITDECLTFTGTTPGDDVTGMVICDDLGFCDTTWLYIHVTDAAPLPIARFDADTVDTGVPAVLFILDNDDLNGELKRLEITTSPDFGTAIMNADHTITYTSNADFCGLDALAYELCNTVGCDTATVNLLVRCPNPEPMNGFSPNNDGMNDGFVIKGLEQYPQNELFIYNRWGEMVYQRKNYKNGEWRGTYENLDLPDGTYFYVLKYGAGGMMSGWLQIER